MWDIKGSIYHRYMVSIMLKNTKTLFVGSHMHILDAQKMSGKKYKAMRVYTAEGEGSEVIKECFSFIFNVIL